MIKMFRHIVHTPKQPQNLGRRFQSTFTRLKSQILRLFGYITLLSSSLSLFGSPIFKEKIQKGQKGDYLVFESNKAITILSIHSIDSSSLVLEEITIPSQNMKKQPSSWAEWVKNKAPGHTSWSMTEIDLKNGEIIECYSFSRSSWIQLSAKENLIATLLQLPLQPLLDEKKPRIGPPPPQGEMDVRKIWEPSLCFEGQKKRVSHFDAYETIWLRDGSELSGKTIFLYFDRDRKFPFPIWLQVEASYGNFSMRSIDAGKNLPSPFTSFPKRIPEFIGQPKKIKNGLRFLVKSPKYYRQFELFAVDITDRDKQIHPISHSLIEGENELLILEIHEDQLRQTLEQNHRYTWLLVPTGHTHSYTETMKPFVWSE